MAYSDDLLEQANHLARKEIVGKPKQASLRRAVSAAYYALFHLLTTDGAIANAPANPAGLRSLVKRSFDHGRMREVCKRVNTGGGLSAPAMALLSTHPPFSPALRTVTRSFVALQEARHAADYDLTAALSRSDAVDLIVDATTAVAAWHSVSGTEEAHVFLAAMLHERLGR